MDINLKAIGTVANGRFDVQDDNWGSVISEIKLDKEWLSKDSLIGIEEFSHIYILFFMDRVSEESICIDARYPRNIKTLPLTGIFSQRAKSRPNRIGLTICEVVSVSDFSLIVKGLDAIDKTPVLDIKPFMKEFSPRSEIKQPSWVKEIMKDYFNH